MPPNNIKRVLKDIKDATINLKREYGVEIKEEENNILNVHFIIPGSIDTPYFGGLYHCMVRLNDDHPMAPPNVYMFTPNGRFKPSGYPIERDDRGICFSTTAYHPESWTPALSLETVIKGMISFMIDDINSDGGAGVKGIETSESEKKRLAKQSLTYLTRHDREMPELFPDLHAQLVCGTYVPQDFSKIDPPVTDKPAAAVEDKTLTELDNTDIIDIDNIDDDVIDTEKVEAVPTKKTSTTKKATVKTPAKPATKATTKTPVKKPTKKPTKKTKAIEIEDDGRMSMRTSEEMNSFIDDDGRRPSERIASAIHDDSVPAKPITVKKTAPKAKVGAKPITGPKRSAAKKVIVDLEEMFGATPKVKKSAATAKKAAKVTKPVTAKKAAKVTTAKLTKPAKPAKPAKIVTAKKSGSKK
jgi:ubiquitin-protein ligase